MADFPSRRGFLDRAGKFAAAGALSGIWAGPGQTPAARANAPAKAPIKIGQIGVQHAHASKLAVYRSSPDYEVVGVVEPNDAAWARTQKQPAFRDLPRLTEEQLLAQPGLQAVLVETHVRDLLAVAARCIAAGKHIHLDKPAGQSLPNYERVLEAARAQNLLVQMGYMYRYNPAIVMLREFLRRGWLGEVFEVHAVMSKVVGANERAALAEFSGGIMFELGCHMIDLVVGVIGPPQKVTPYMRHVARQADGLQDNMLAVMETDKALATVKSTAVEVEGGARRHLVVCGTEGTFHIQPIENPVATIALAAPHEDFRAGMQTRSFTQPKYTRYVADAADMAQIIRGEKPSDFSYEHDLAVQRCVLQASGM